MLELLRCDKVVELVGLVRVGDDVIPMTPVVVLVMTAVENGVGMTAVGMTAVDDGALGMVTCAVAVVYFVIVIAEEMVAVNESVAGVVLLDVVLLRGFIVCPGIVQLSPMAQAIHSFLREIL